MHLARVKPMYILTSKLISDISFEVLNRLYETKNPVYRQIIYVARKVIFNIAFIFYIN